MKRATLVCGTLVVGLAWMITTVDARLRRVSIGTNPVGTIYFVIGGGIAKLFTQELRIPSRAVPHAGSSVYMPLLDQGEITLGLNSSLDSALAHRGDAPYNRVLDVDALARVFVMPYAYVVKARSGIESVADLRGKRVVVDIKGNASLAALNWAMLATAGLSREDVRPIDVGGLEQGIAALTEGRADAAPIAMGIPLLSQADAGIPGGVRVVPLGPEASDEFIDERARGSRVVTVGPSDQFVGVDCPTLVSAFDTYLNVGSHVEADDAYLLVQTLYRNWSKLRQEYPALGGTTPEELAPPTNPHPYAEGAIRFFKESGLWTEAHETRQGQLRRGER